MMSIRLADRAFSSFCLQVECYSGYRGEETPRRFRLGERLVEVRQITDRWLGPDYRYFKIQGCDGGIYILRHSCETNTWQLAFFASRKMTSGKPAPE